MNNVQLTCLVVFIICLVIITISVAERLNVDKLVEEETQEISKQTGEEEMSDEKPRCAVCGEYIEKLTFKNGVNVTMCPGTGSNPHDPTVCVSSPAAEKSEEDKVE